MLDYSLMTEYDRSLLDAVNRSLGKNEKVQWSGKPKYEFSLTPLEIGGHDVALGPTNLYFVAMGMFWFYGFSAFQDGNDFKTVILVCIGLLVFLIPDIFKEIRRRKTSYIVTSNRIFFNLWRMNKKHLHQIEIKDIQDSRYEAYDDKSGVLYLIMKDTPSFKTYDFSAGGVRHYLTLEKVPDVIALQEKIIQLKKALDV